MLKRPLPVTPTFTISFEQSLSAPPTIFEYTSLKPYNHFVTGTLLLDEDFDFLPRKRLRGTIKMQTASLPIQEEGRKQAVDISPSPFQPSITTLAHPAVPMQESHTSTFAAGQHSSNGQGLAEKDIAGPSRLGFAFRRETVKGAAIKQIGERRRKMPVKLLSPPQSSDSMQTKEVIPGIRSMPSSPMFPSKFGKATDEVEKERESLRDSLRGTPRRRPSVPFGMRT
jgi:hypothetical protein